MGCSLQRNDQQAETITLHHLRLGAGCQVAGQRARLPVLAGEQHHSVGVLADGLEHAHALADDGFGVGGEPPRTPAVYQAHDDRPFGDQRAGEEQHLHGGAGAQRGPNRRGEARQRHGEQHQRAVEQLAARKEQRRGEPQLPAGEVHGTVDPTDAVSVPEPGIREPILCHPSMVTDAERRVPPGAWTPSSPMPRTGQCVCGPRCRPDLRI